MDTDHIQNLDLAYLRSERPEFLPNAYKRFDDILQKLYNINSITLFVITLFLLYNAEMFKVELCWCASHRAN
jgi:hypothetical protein